MGKCNHHFVSNAMGSIYCQHCGKTQTKKNGNKRNGGKRAFYTTLRIIRLIITIFFLGFALFTIFNIVTFYTNTGQTPDILDMIIDGFWTIINTIHTIMLEVINNIFNSMNSINSNNSSIETECKDKCQVELVDVTRGDWITVKHQDNIHVVRLALIKPAIGDEIAFQNAISFTKNACTNKDMYINLDENVFKDIIGIKYNQYKDNYDRYIAEVTCDGKILNKSLVDNGHAIIIDDISQNNNKTEPSEFRDSVWYQILYKK